MRVGLFVPCYIDQLYPDVAISTLEVLEQFGVQVHFPNAQTCCGQPMANTGCADQAAPMARRMIEIFHSFDYVVCPSGSCTAMVTHHYGHFFHTKGRDAYEKLRKKTYEFTQFVAEFLRPERFDIPFPHRVGLHQSCHGLRELRLGQCSERMLETRDLAGELLSKVPGLTLVKPTRVDECCGFGGTFAVAEADVSVAMGQSRIEDHLQAGAEVVTAGDMSCLMHLQGLLERQKQPLRVMHLAQILAGRPKDINVSTRGSS